MEELNYKVEKLKSIAVEDMKVEDMKEQLNNVGTVTDSEGENVTVESTETNAEDAGAESVERARQELMELISDPRIIQAYRKARGNAARQHVSKTDKKKKKAKRRMSNNSRKH